MADAITTAEGSVVTVDQPTAQQQLAQFTPQEVEALKVLADKQIVSGEAHSGSGTVTAASAAPDGSSAVGFAATTDDSKALSANASSLVIPTDQGFVNLTDASAATSGTGTPDTQGVTVNYNVDPNAGTTTSGAAGAPGAATVNTFINNTNDATSVAAPVTIPVSVAATETVNQPVVAELTPEMAQLMAGNQVANGGSSVPISNVAATTQPSQAQLAEVMQRLGLEQKTGSAMAMGGQPGNN